MALDPLTEGLTLGDDLIQLIAKHVTDPQAQAQIIAETQKEVIAAAQASDTAQAQIMAAEAAQKGIFNKPHLMLAWICVGALFFDLILTPLVMWAGYALGYPIPKPPTLANETVSTLLYGVFGLGGLSVTHGLVKQWVATP
jgi:hypothetical protein